MDGQRQGGEAMTPSLHYYRHPGAAEPCGSIGPGDIAIDAGLDGFCLVMVLPHSGVDPAGRPFIGVRSIAPGYHRHAGADELLAIPRDRGALALSMEWGSA